MGIRGIEHLTGGTMESEQQPVEGQQDESASAPPEQVDPPTPAHEEADRASGKDPEDDVAPDADEPGDTEVDSELEKHVQDSPDQADEPDQEG